MCRPLYLYLILNLLLKLVENIMLMSTDTLTKETMVLGNNDLLWEKNVNLPKTVEP